MKQIDFSKLDLTKTAASFRGHFIDTMVIIERCIDDFIAQHFCKDHKRRVEFLEYVICQEGIPFERKRQILMFILENNYPETFNSLKNELKIIAGLIEKRNVLAHYLLDNSVQGKADFNKTGEIRFVKIKNGQSLLKFTHEDAFKISEDLKTAKNVIIKKLFNTSEGTTL